MLLRHVVPITDRLQAARADLVAYAAGETGHAAGRRVPERRHAHPAGDHRALHRGAGRASRSAWSEAASDEGLMDMVRARAPRPHVRRPAAPRRAVRGRRAPARPVRARDGRGVAAGAAYGRRPSLQLHRRAAADRLPVLPQHQLAGGPPPARTATSPTSCSAPRTTAPSRRWPPPASGPRSCRSSRSTGPTRRSRSSPRTSQPRRIALMWHRERYRSPASRAFVDIAARRLRRPRDGARGARPAAAPDACRLPDGAFARAGARREPAGILRRARQPAPEGRTMPENSPRTPSRRRRRRHRRRRPDDDPGPPREAAPDHGAAAARLRAQRRHAP